MGHVCPQHRGLSADYGSCAPLYIPDERSEAERAAQAARDRARKLSEALARCADSMHHASVAAREARLATDLVGRAALTLAANGHRADARAALHLHPELSRLMED